MSTTSKLSRAYLEFVKIIVEQAETLIQRDEGRRNFGGR